MAYTTTNFKTKTSLRNAVALGQEVRVYQPGPFGGDLSDYCGEISIEGPHFPEPHRWYARVKVEHGRIIQVR